jgi:hypothetical protein
MKVFRDMIISGDEATLRNVVCAIEARLASGWIRDRTTEERIRPAVPGTSMYCIAAPVDSTRPAAVLWLALNPIQHCLSVTNIIPTQTIQLSIPTYNAILEEFYARFASPAADEMNATHELTKDNVEIEDWAGKRAANLLRAFAGSANKSTGSAHPLDRKRWEAFLVAAHRDHAKLSAGELQRWLVEVEHWPEDVAADLAIEYEQGRSLLAEYDQSA